MKHYLVVFTGTASDRTDFDNLHADPRGRHVKNGMAARGHWVENHAADIVDSARYMKVDAGSEEAITRLFANHPRFRSFSTDAGDVTECLPTSKSA